MLASYHQDLSSQQTTDAVRFAISMPPKSSSNVAANVAGCDWSCVREQLFFTRMITHRGGLHREAELPHPRRDEDVSYQSVNSNYRCQPCKIGKHYARIVVRPKKREAQGERAIMSNSSSQCQTESRVPPASAWVREGANKRGNSSRLTQSFHFFMFEPFFLP